MVWNEKVLLSLSADKAEMEEKAGVGGGGGGR